MCHSTRVLRKGVCRIFNPDMQTCLKLAIKLSTYMHGQIDNVVGLLNGTQIRDTVKQVLDDQIPGIKEEIMSMKMYYTTYDNIWFGFMISIIVDMLVNHCPWTYACLDTDGLPNIHNTSESSVLSVNGTTMFTWIELTTSIDEMQEDGNSLTKFYESIPHPSKGCVGKEVVYFKKTNVCPYVEINKDDLDLRKRNDRGTQNETELYIRVLESWQYEDLGSQWRICFEDFVDSYARHRKQSNKLNDWRGDQNNLAGLAGSGDCCMNAYISLLKLCFALHGFVYT